MFHRVNDAWPEVNSPCGGRDRECRGSALCRMFAFGFHRDFLLAPHVQFASRKRALINFAASVEGVIG